LKIKKSFCIWAAVSVACMAAIFWFSAQSAEKSGELSGSFTRRIFADLFGMDSAGPVMNILEVLIRKAAHVWIYAVLSFCTAYSIRQITENKRRIFLISVCWCSLYAVTDELHQHFVPGRAAMWQDWLIDTAGALIGVCMAFFVMWLTKGRKKKFKFFTPRKY